MSVNDDPIRLLRMVSNSGKSGPCALPGVTKHGSATGMAMGGLEPPT